MFCLEGISQKNICKRNFLLISFEELSLGLAFCSSSKFPEELGVESSDYIGQTGRLNPRSRKIIADYLKVKGAKTTLDRFGGSKVARGFYGVKIKEKDKEKIKEK